MPLHDGQLLRPDRVRHRELREEPLEEAVRVVVLEVPVHLVEDGELLRLDLLHGEGVLHARAQRRDADRDRARQLGDDEERGGANELEPSEVDLDGGHVAVEQHHAEGEDLGRDLEQLADVEHPVG